MREKVSIRAVALCALAASAPAQALPSAADDQRFRREDIPLPPGVVSAIPIGGSEAGDIVGLAWDAAGNPSVWLRLADSGFGIPAGWVPLGSASALSRFGRVVVPSDGSFMAVSSRDAGEPSALIVGTRVGNAWHASRSVLEGGAEFDVRAVSNDGVALGFALPQDEGAVQRLAWLSMHGTQLIELPSADCAALLPTALTTERRALAVAKFEDGRAPRAVLVVEGHARFLDELADGAFPWASVIQGNGAVTTAVTREDGRLGICRLVDLGIDGNGDGEARLDDFPVFLERYLESSELCDVDLSGSVEATDVFKWIDTISDSSPPGLGARAVELVGSASRIVSSDSFPSAVLHAARAQIAFLGESEVSLGFAQTHTLACVEHVVTASPACGVVWDAACDAIAQVFYAQVAEANGPISVECREVTCAADPTCCEAWDESCLALSSAICSFPAPPGCPFTQPWPYDASNPIAWSHCGAVGGTSFESVCFNHCCADHDMCYSTCGAYGADPSEGDPFAGCNERFLDCMLASCIDNSRPTDPLHSWCGTSRTCKSRALAYYLAVHWFSDPAWCACCATVTPERCAVPLPVPMPTPAGEEDPGWWRYLEPFEPLLVPGPITAPQP